MEPENSELLTELAEIRREMATRCSGDEMIRLRQRVHGIEAALYAGEDMGLPWCRPFWFLPGRGGRCTAVLESEYPGRWGRCELRPHPRSVDHALDYGMHPLRFATTVTG